MKMRSRFYLSSVVVCSLHVEYDGVLLEVAFDVFICLHKIALCSQGTCSVLLC